MIELDYAAMQGTPLGEAPFRHLLVPEFVAESSLTRIIEDLPPLQKGGSFPIGSLGLGDEASRLIEALEGDRFRTIIANRFELDLSGAPTMITLRGQSREKDGRIHCDSLAKRVTVLLYLNPAAAAWSRQEGCLRLLRGPDDIEDYAAEVPPVAGTLLVFPNGPTTWHGHKQFIGRRYVVQLNYMTNDNAARSELFRHRVSAIFKRLVAA